MADAEVWIVPLAEGLRERLESRFGLARSELEELSIRRRSDEEGRVDLAGVRLPVFVAVRGRGTAPAGLFLTKGPAEGTSWDLPAESVVRGRVVGLHVDEPLGDVWVRGRRKYEHPDEAYRDPDRIAGMFFESRVRPGPDGRFELRGLGAGYAEIVAWAPGRRSQDDFRMRLPTDGDLILKLLNATVVRGRVVAKKDGRPIAGAVVQQIQPAGEFSQYTLARALSDANGEFGLQCVNGLEAGVTLRVEAGGFASTTMDLPSARARSGAAIVVELSTECVAEGRVVSTDGEPFVETVWVQVRPTDGRVWTSIVTCGRDGAFTLNGLDPDVLYDVIAQTPDHYRGGFLRTYPCEGEDLNIDLEPAPRIDGRVADEEGRPVAGCRIRLTQEDAVGNRVYEHIDEVDPGTGEFHALAGMGTGNYVLEAWAPGFAPQRIEPVKALQPPARVDPLEVVLKKGRVVQGTVVDAQTRTPVVSASVSLGDLSLTGEVLGPSGMSEPVVTDGEGFFRLEGYPAEGQWPLVVAARGYATARVDVQPQEGAAGPWTLPMVALERAASVNVRVFDDDGRAFTSVLVVARGPSDERRRVESGSDGVARVRDLPPGEWYFHVILYEPGIVALNSRDHSLKIPLSPGEHRDLDVRLGGATLFGRLSGDAAQAARDEYNRIVIIAHPLEPSTDLDDLGVWVVHDRYELRGVPAGRYWVEARSNERNLGFSKQRLVDVPASGRVEVNFDVPATGFEGLVSDASAGVVADARVRALALRAQDDRPVDNAARMETHSAPDGRYVLLGLKPGRYALVVSRDGYGREVRVATVPEGSAGLETEDVTLRREAIVEVSVRSRGGQELADAQVHLEAVSSPPVVAYEGHAVEGEGASWWYGGLSEEPLRVRAAAPGHFAEEREVRPVSGRRERVEFSLRRLGALRVRVKRFEGGAASGWPVSVVDEETGTDVASWLGVRGVESSTGSLVTDERGELVLRGLPEGRYRLSAGGAPEHAVVVPGAEPAEASLLAGG